MAPVGRGRRPRLSLTVHASRLIENDRCRPAVIWPARGVQGQRQLAQRFLSSLQA